MCVVVCWGGVLETVTQRPRLAEAPSSGSDCTDGDRSSFGSSCSGHSDSEFPLLFWNLGISPSFFCAQLGVPSFYPFDHIYNHFKQKKNIHLIKTSWCQKLNVLRGYIPKHFQSQLSILFILCMNLHLRANCQSAQIPSIQKLPYPTSARSGFSYAVSFRHQSAISSYTCKHF